MTAACARYPATVVQSPENRIRNAAHRRTSSIPGALEKLLLPRRPAPPRAPRPVQHKRRAVPGAQSSARISAPPNSSADGGRQPHAGYYDPPIATGHERSSVLAARADPPVLPFMSEHVVPTRASAERSTDRARTIIRLAKRRPMSCRAGRMPPRRYLFQNSSAPHRRGASRQQRRAGGATENERPGQRQAATLPPTTFRNPADRRTYTTQRRAATGSTEFVRRTVHQHLPPTLVRSKGNAADQLPFAYSFAG